MRGLVVIVMSVFLVVTLVLAVGILAVVAVGVGGRYTEKNSKFTSFAAQAAEHLNGDAPAPERIAKLLK